MLEEQQKHEQAAPSLDIRSMLEIFQQHAGKLDRVFIFVDAIDECSKKEGVFELLITMTKSLPNVCLIISSTEHLSKKVPLDGIKIIHEYMDSEKVDLDISTFVDEQLNSIRTLRRSDSIAKSNIRKAILKHSNGM